VNVAAKLGDADLTSVTGYSVNTITTHLDATPVLSDVTSLVFPGVTGAPDPVDNETEKFTEELRVSIPLGERFEWLVGAFYTHEDVSSHQAIQAADANTGTVIATTYDFTAPYTFAEYAAFTDVTVHFTDRFDVQVGGRQSHNRQTYSSQATGPFVPIFYGVPSPLVTPEVESSESAFTYLVTPRLRITPELMLYARLASGYRPGGPTPNATALGLPPQYDADKTQNYEIGLKGDAFDQALTFDASLYYIDWKDIQVQLRDPVNFTSYLANGSRARSRGAELSVESRPRTGLTLSGWVSWNDAELTEDFPAGSTAVGTKGARLPYSGRFSGNVSVDQDFAIANNVIAFAGASLSYVGERQGIFASIFAPSPQRQVFPSYTKTDVRAGVRYDTWTFNVFVNNLTDRRGVLTGGLDNLIVPFAFNYIQPRTAGLSLTKTL
jgi:outer membrane receptor protein involved in Fe transport